MESFRLCNHLVAEFSSGPGSDVMLWLLKTLLKNCKH